MACSKKIRSAKIFRKGEHDYRSESADARGLGWQYAGYLAVVPVSSRRGDGERSDLALRLLHDRNARPRRRAHPSGFAGYKTQGIVRILRGDGTRGAL